MTDSISSVGAGRALDAVKQNQKPQTERAQEAKQATPVDRVELSEEAAAQTASQISQSVQNSPSQTLGLNADFEV